MNKTNKSLLVKFLTVVCSLCLSLGLVFGLVGCGEEEATLVNAVINENGQLVLTYSDGYSKTVDIIGKDGEDASVCAHTNKTLTKFSPAASIEGACHINIYICKDCGHTLSEATAHEFETEATPEVAPTCTKDGKTEGFDCKYCEYRKGAEVIEKLDHKLEGESQFVEKYVAYSDNATICDNGGWLISACKLCGEVEKQELVGPLGHVSTKWEKNNDKLPTLDAAGELKAAQCDRCGETNVSYKLAKLSDEDVYTQKIIEKRKTCTGVDKIEFSTEVQGQTFKFETNSKAGKHVIKAGMEFDASKVYTFDATLFQELDGHDRTCHTNGFSVFFKCINEECGANIPAKAKLAHQTVEEYNKANNTTLTAALDAGCTTDGYYNDYVCGGCSETISNNGNDEMKALVKIDRTGHNYKYEIVKTYATGEHAGKVDITGTCKNECGVADDYPKAIATTKTIKEATCTEEGEVLWTVTSPKTVTFKEITDKVPHQLNGENMELDTLYNWNEYKDKGFELIGEAGAAETCADGGFNAFFKCDNCPSNVPVSASIPHTKPEGFVNNATCIASGTYICAKCTSGVDETEDQSLAKLEHKYTYTASEVAVNGDFTITGTCVHGESGHNEDKPYSVVYELNIEDEDLESAVKLGHEPRCDYAGLIVYTFTIPNTTTKVSVEVAGEKLQHELNGKKMTQGATYQYTSDFQLLGTLLACEAETEVDAFFKCDNCPSNVPVKVIQKHTRPEGLEPNDSWSGYCDEAKTYSYECQVCHKQVVNEADPVEKHTYKYVVDETYTAPTANSTGTVKVACSKCDKDLEISVTLPKLSETSKYTINKVSDPTCQAVGVTTYKYTDTTYGTFDFNVEDAKVDHTYLTDSEGSVVITRFTYVEGTGNDAVTYVYHAKFCTVENRYIVFKVTVADQEVEEYPVIPTPAA